MDISSEKPTFDVQEKTKCTSHDKTVNIKIIMPKKNMIAKICPTCKQQVTRWIGSEPYFRLINIILGACSM